MNSSRKVKWTTEALKSYRSVGDDMEASGRRAMRSFNDPDCNSSFTIWQGGKHTVITQVFCDTGDVCFYKSCLSDEVLPASAPKEVA